MTDRTHYCAGCKGREDIIRKLEAEVERLTLTVRKLQGHQGALEADNARLREVLWSYTEYCNICHGRGSIIEEDDVTGADLWRDCPGCTPASAALQETSHDA